jgi:replication-associated recombination protein RarA
MTFDAHLHTLQLEALLLMHQAVVLFRRAIAKAVLQTLTLWQGPPGTGKTRTLLALVEVRTCCC